ncbi:MAG: acetolactate synthase small subunit [Bacteroidota bacterium]
MKEYTLSIYTEDQVGLLNRIAAIFTRRKINIESLNSSPTEVPGIYRFTVVIHMEEETIEKVAKQIEKQVDVLKVYFNTEEEIIWQEMGLYKVPTEEIASKVQVERLLRSHGARVVVVRNDYIIFEQTGQRQETEALIKVLEPYGLIEFVRSARIAIIKASSGFHEKLLEFENTSREQETEAHPATT